MAAISISRGKRCLAPAHQPAHSPHPKATSLWSPTLAGEIPMIVKERCLTSCLARLVVRLPHRCVVSMTSFKTMVVFMSTTEVVNIGVVVLSGCFWLY